jgi:hypothetical protein
MLDYDDLEASVLDEKKATHGQGNHNVDVCEYLGTSPSKFASNNDNGKSPLAGGMPYLPIYNIDKRGKLNDLNKASKNFNLPMNVDI